MSDALVLVGAGPGLGSAIAERFATEGWSVGLLAHKAEVVDAGRAELAPTGVPVATAVANVTDRASMQDAFASMTGELGPPSTVVYNASMAPPESVLDLEPETLRRALDLHVVGALNTAQCAVAAMRDIDRGVLIFTVNNQAIAPEQSFAALGVGKGAQRNLVLSPEQALADTGISVGIVRIAGLIQPGTAFDPANIAHTYWAVATQDPTRFERDHVFDGA